jgi:hypothetical protein
MVMIPVHTCDIMGMGHGMSQVAKSPTCTRTCDTCDPKPTSFPVLMPNPNEPSTLTSDTTSFAKQPKTANSYIPSEDNPVDIFFKFLWISSELLIGFYWTFWGVIL